MFTPSRPGRRRGPRGFESLESRDLLATLSVAAVSVSESSDAAVFVATLDEAATTPVVVTYSTANGTAKAGRDYARARSSVTIPAGSTSATFSVPILDDAISELSETFRVNVASKQATVATKSVAATIVDNEASPTVSVGDLSITEADRGSRTATVLVSLSNPSSRAVRISYVTEADTATGTGTTRDYQPVSGTLVIKAGATSGRIKVKLRGDRISEPDEVLNLKLTRAVDAVLESASEDGVHSRIVIRDNDTLGLTRPTLSVSSPTVTEGDAAVFTATLSAATDRDVSVRYTTVSGTAGASDYTETDAVLTIAAGQTSATISIPTASRSGTNGSRTFSLVLSAPANADLAATTATATIVDRNVTPTISASGATVAEGDSGTASATFTVSLSTASDKTVTVGYATADGTATAGVDYNAASGTLTFAPGETSKTVRVGILGDAVYEGSETFSLVLSSPTNATLATATAASTIANDDPAPTVSIAGTQTAEGASGSTTPVTFTVTLDAASSLSGTVNYATVDGTAVAGRDYTAASGTLTFAPGETSKTITVEVLGNDAFESDKTFSVVLSGASNLTVASGTAGVATITNDDTTPGLAIASATASEGDSGTTILSFPVTLTKASDTDVTVSYATSNLTATAGSDYNAASGTLTILAGQTSGVITVTILGDTTIESDETFALTLSSLAGDAVLLDAAATGTIVNDDLPGLSVSGGSVTEGNSGSKNLTFTVSLSAASSSAVSVAYATANSTATAGSDYTAASGTITFAAGETSETISVAVLGDTAVESDETFTLSLSNPTNASVAVASAAGTILNDDTASSTTTTLSSNLSATTGGAESASGSTWLATSFTTDTSSYTLSSVTLLLAAASSSTVSVQIYSDGGDGLLPGSSLGTLTLSGSLSTSASETTFTSTGITLSASTTYWIVLVASSGSVDWSWTTDSTGSGTGFTSTWATTPDAGETWFPYTNYPLQMAVKATKS